MLTATFKWYQKLPGKINMLVRENSQKKEHVNKGYEKNTQPHSYENIKIRIMF